MTKKVFALFLILLAVYGCNITKKRELSYEFIEIPNSDYTLVKIKTPVEIDSVQCLRMSLEVKYNVDQYVYASAWLPQDTIKSKNKICLLIPPFMNNTMVMSPIAVKLLKKNIPVAFLSYRGVEGDKMENFEKDYVIEEVNDGVYLLQAVEQYLNYDSLKSVKYGVSIGSAIALNIADNEPSIKGLVLEALPYDFEKTAKKMYSGKSLNEINSRINFQQIKAYQPNYRIPKLNKNINVLGIWAARDKYILKEDIDSLISIFQNNKINFNYHLINSGAHHFRGYPLSRQESDSLDNLIVDFIYKNLME